MREAHAKMSKSSSWPKAKTVVRKWLNLRNSDFHSDCISLGGWLRESSENLKYGSPAPPKELRVFVGTWNVGGRAPHGGLDLSDWLVVDGPASSSAHLYVLGFQEIVPLNAGNVLGAEDEGPAFKWLHLIRRALNPPPPSSSSSSSWRGHSFPPSHHRCATGTTTTNQEENAAAARASFSELLLAAAEDRRLSTASSEPDDDDDSEPSTTTSNPESSSEAEDASDDVVAAGHEHDDEGGSSSSRRRHHGGYRLAASKQMVGIFLCVWVRADLTPFVASVKVSCVGRGIMGYMGNKGSISVSLALLLLQGSSSSSTTTTTTTMCFVCTHLASGEKDGDEARRNSDVAEILKRTRFRPSAAAAARSPETILEHDKVIWLGDLNYRLTTTTTTGGTRELLLLLLLGARRDDDDWEAVLERDQLRVEQRAGRVFAGACWEEGRIRFPPTYKYLAGSDAYAMSLTSTSDKRRRTPAWCDRILWRGEGVTQLLYARGESRFSDHRPVSSLFSARLDLDG